MQTFKFNLTGLDKGYLIEQTLISAPNPIIQQQLTYTLWLKLRNSTWKTAFPVSLKAGETAQIIIIREDKDDPS